MASKDKTVAVRHHNLEFHGYEFLGSFGAFAISFLLPILVYFFAFACNDISGCPAPSLLHPSTFTLSRFKQEIGWPQDGIWGLGSWKATAAVVAYNILNLVLYRVIPATEANGVPLPKSGLRLKYRINCMACNSAILAMLLAGTLAQGAEFPVYTFISENYIQILTANLIIAYVMATYVYVRSFTIDPTSNDGRELAPGGLSGNMLYDWFIGRELNPRVSLPLIGEVDLKEFLELRPGMLGWQIMNAAWCAQQYRTFGYVTDSIIFVTAVQLLYISDSWYNESAILTTMDIATDGFGMMLSFADFVWEPYMFALQTRYLAVHPISLGPVHLIFMLSIIGLGFYIFRSANNQKHAFRTNPQAPDVAHLETMDTKRGTKLLVSGWWGASRHINYLGDWTQSWAYCLPTGLAGYTIMSAGTVAEEGGYVMNDGRVVVAGEAKGWALFFTYFYVIYFGVLLIHREIRDDDKCKRKYGDDWEKYKKIVRYRIVPGIY